MSYDFEIKDLIIAALVVLFMITYGWGVNKSKALENKSEPFPHFISFMGLSFRAEDVEYEGCQYLYIKNSGYGWVVHKGNCTNLIHFTKLER